MNEHVHERRTVEMSFENNVRERTLSSFVHRSFMFRSSFDRDPPSILLDPLEV